MQLLRERGAQQIKQRRVDSGRESIQAAANVDLRTGIDPTRQRVTSFAQALLQVDALGLVTAAGNAALRSCSPAITARSAVGKLNL